MLVCGGISETLGFVHMMRELYTQDWRHIVHRVDANACRAIIFRRGCGGLKHPHCEILVGSRSSS